MQIIKNFIIEDEGAEVAEYALLVVLLALGIIAALPTFTSALKTAFDNTGSRVSKDSAVLNP
jgi:Flp pilus assembly pilin Flp